MRNLEKDVKKGASYPVGDLNCDRPLVA